MAINLAGIERETCEKGGDLGRAGARWSTLARKSLFAPSKVSVDELLIFTRQLALLLRTGNTLAPSVRALSDQARSDAFANALRRVYGDLQGGASFSESLERHPSAFGPLYVNLVRAGEATGALLESLGRLAGILEIERGLRARIREATTYPIVLLLVMVGVLLFTMSYVLPRFADLFAGVESELPATTRVLISVSSAAHSRWWLLPPITLFVICAVRWSWSMGPLRRTWDRVKVLIPLVGRLYEEAYLYRLFSSLGLLLASHVPLLDSVEIARGIIRDTRYGAFFDNLLRHVEVGHGVTPAFEEAAFLPNTVKLMVATGEKSGALDTVMGNLAERYREELESDVRRFTSLVEPALLVVMGLLVGLIAVSLIVPIFRMSRAIN